MRSTDWSRTSMGPVESWPQSLRTAISMMLESRFAMVVAWGPEFRFFYNDRYRPVLGGKHPASLGTPAVEIFPEVWPMIGPEFERVWRGESFAIDDWLLPLDRNGYLENCWFTVSYSPIRDESGGVGGLLAVVAETTERVEGERRMATLRDLARRAAEAKTPEHAGREAAGVLALNPTDVPFALLHLLEDDGRRARLVAGVGLPEDHPARQLEVDLTAAAGDRGWPLQLVVQNGEAAVLSDAGVRFGGLPGGDAPEPTHTAVLLPLSRPGVEHAYGVLVAGVSPRRALDGRYRDFFELAADHIATAISNARAFEEERRRAEALADIDRAKTAFFSNVSHEFRTPLTLMLGPLEEALGRPAGELAGEDLAVVHRNALRLLKLVNALLEFSRIETGRLRAAFEPVDLGALTRDLASTFRSAVERAGLELVVETPPLPEPAFVDRSMWETIVLNLLSNAFKFTFEGRIRVRVHEEGEFFALTVEDSGVGIPEAELPRVFDRFHRVAGMRARTHEGSGIGLALVQELARLHGGEARVASAPGAGSRFVVTIRRGHAHVPTGHLAAEGQAGGRDRVRSAFVEEALRWIDEGAPLAAAPPAESTEPAARILVADDNADMRDYLRRILGRSWSVDAVADGGAALQRAIADVPDLLLSDVMMPGLDGFELLRALRANARTRAIPVIMLSARAGEEATVEGLQAGADDYLVKPFGARELVARVRGQLALARAKSEADRLRAEAVAASRAKDEFLAMLSHELRNPLAPIRTAVQVVRLKVGDAIDREVTVLERQLDHLVRLVDDLLDVARIARGKIEIQREPLELADVVARAIEVASPLLEQRRHQLLVESPPPGLRVSGDAHRLTQVFANLLTNAARYTEPGGRIEVRARAGEGGAEVTVRDNGMGIEPNLLPRIFDLFVQGGSEGHPRSRGLGLGLAIVRNLVDLHGGSVAGSSPGPGRGSEFTVRLPLIADAAPAARPVSPAAALVARGPAHRILIVDDNLDAADMLATALSLGGHDVRIASDGPSAIESAVQFRPHVALLDIGLPVMDGYELAQRLRAIPELESMGLVAVTGYGAAADQDRARRTGFQAHLTKPVDFLRVQEALAALLTRAD
jgi:signal transduction histidine kinase